MKILQCVFLLILSMIPDSCDDQLVLINEPYATGQLRIDGYYCQMYNDQCGSVYFLYNNGTLLYGGGDSSKKPEDREKEFQKEEWIRAVRKFKSWWGVFRIDRDRIALEEWHPSSGGPLPAYISSGKILDDTTFIITSRLRSYDYVKQLPDFLPEISESIDGRISPEIYRFRKFGPKPDSTNRFVPTGND